MTETTEQARKRGANYLFLFVVMFTDVMIGILIAPFLIKDITVRCFGAESAVTDSANREVMDEARKPPILIDSEAMRSVPGHMEDVFSTAPAESTSGGASSEEPINEFMTSDPEGEASVDKGAPSPSGN